MDLWKLLIVGVIAVGLLLILGRPPELPKLPEGFRVEEGTFRIVTTTGAREEIFGIYPVDAGFRVVSLLHERGKVLLEANLLYGPDWAPLAGTITQRSPQEVRWLFAFTTAEAVVRKQVGPRETMETFPLSERAFPWDSDLMAPWDALFRAGPEGLVQLLDVRQGSMHRISIGPPEETKLRVIGRAVPAQRLVVTQEEGTLRFYRQGDLLIGVSGEGFVAFMVEVLPEGVQEIP